jgi:hypothetical protein
VTSYQLKAGMPAMTLDAGCTITVEAIDPASGATVTGVTVSQVAIYGTNDDAGPPLELTPVPPLLVLDLGADTGTDAGASSSGDTVPV